MGSQLKAELQDLVNAARVDVFVRVESPFADVREREK